MWALINIFARATESTRAFFRGESDRFTWVSRYRRFAARAVASVEDLVGKGGVMTKKASADDLVAPFGARGEKWRIGGTRTGTAVVSHPAIGDYEVTLLGAGYYPEVPPYYRRFESVVPDERVSVLAPKRTRVEEIVRYGAIIRWSIRQETTMSSQMTTTSYLVEAGDSAKAAALSERLTAARSKRPTLAKGTIYQVYRALQRLQYRAPF